MSSNSDGGNSKPRARMAPPPTNPNNMAERTPPIDPTQFRRVLGRFSTGITVVTTQSGARVHGMTANAFMSGSLDPPMVVTSIARRAKLHDLLDAAGTFGVSVLRADEELYGSHFVGEPHTTVRPEFEYCFGIPVLGGALATIAADVERSFECGDHTLFIGRVRHLACGEGDPLVFYAGAFRHLAESEEYFHAIDFVW